MSELSDAPSTTRTDAPQSVSDIENSVFASEITSAIMDKHICEDSLK